jgi:Fe2+ or Zn2+ uptake regulation protein
VEYLEDAERLRRQGHRLTPQRLQVLQVIKAHGDHVTAEAIRAAIILEQPYLDIATVYRTLQWLQRVGLVAPIRVGQGKTYYEYRRHNECHHHLVCQRCRQHVEIPNEQLDVLKDDLWQHYGFTMQVDHLALPGWCASCRGENEKG